jgi:hypothetical protein
MSFWMRRRANATFCAAVILEKSGDPSDFFGIEPSPPKWGGAAGFGMTLAATTFPDVLGADTPPVLPPMLIVTLGLGLSCDVGFVAFVASETLLPVPA